MTELTKTSEQELHRQKMQAQKGEVDGGIAAANIELGVQFCVQNGRMS